ncbi:MAG: acyl-CoA thioesterase [Calothrix sp. SM1_7_51]|nr:acyl-CoA thioesterase [Calothrix sp. SM1_7_51]
MNHRPLEVELIIPVKTYDIDFAGIVSNIVYIRWLEDLRLKLLDEYLPLEKQMQLGRAPIMTGTQIEYKRQIKLFDSVIGRAWMSELKRVKWVIQAEFLLHNEIAAQARQTGAFICLEKKRPVEIPLELQQEFSKHA